MDEIEQTKLELLGLLAVLTKKAVEQAKEKGVETAMLDAIRENIKFLIERIS